MREDRGGLGPVRLGTRVLVHSVSGDGAGLPVLEDRGEDRGGSHEGRGGSLCSGTTGEFCRETGVDRPDLG